MRAWIVLVASVQLAGQTAIVDSHTSCLLGGWHQNKWVSGQSLAPALGGERVYRLYGSTDPTASVRGATPKPIEGPCGDAMEVEFDSELPEGSIAVTGNATGFKPESLPLNARAYMTAFRTLLDTRGVRTAVRMEQLMRLDLDGDGKLEVVASLYSGRRKATVSRPGDYSMIVFRRVGVNDRVTTQVIDFEKHPRTDGITHMAIGPIVDLNGDGKAEIVIRGDYAKGLYSHVYELRDGKFVRVLECTCGD